MPRTFPRVLMQQGAQATPIRQVATLLLRQKAIAKVANALLSLHQRGIEDISCILYPFFLLLSYMRFVSLSRHSYYRCTERYIYIANQLSGIQVVYEASCANWIKKISHTPRTIDSIIAELIDEYVDVEEAELRKDYLDFLSQLLETGLILVGSSQDEFVSPKSIDIPQNSHSEPITDLTIEITNRCNERCVHCYLPNELKDNGHFMSTDSLKKLVDDFSDLGGKSVTLTGGEVLLHKGLIDLLYYIHSKSLAVAIYSNLIALSDEQLQALKDIGINDIQVSLYGITAETHDSITSVPGSCKRTLNAIHRLKSYGLPVRIACPVMKENCSGVISLLKYAKEVGADVDLELNITPRADKSTDNLLHRLDMSEMRLFLENLMTFDPLYTEKLLHRHNNKYDESFNLAEYLNYPVCTAGHYGLYITVDGCVTTCPNLQGLEMGKYPDLSLKRIWTKSSEIIHLRSISESIFEKCIDCEASDYCFRCFARNFTETGCILSIPEYACDMAFLSKQVVENYKNKYADPTSQE